MIGEASLSEEPSRGRRSAIRHNPFTIASDGARKQGNGR
jgi:hypothetical protein